MAGISLRQRCVLCFAAVLFLGALPPHATAVEVMFPDRNLETHVRRELMIPAPLPITDTQMLWLLSLDCPLDSETVSNLGGLEYAANLRTLTLRDHEVSDLSPLSGLRNLRELDLYHNLVSDLSPLSDMTQITYLNLTYNQVSDISALSGLTSLTTLALSGGNRVSDLRPLAGTTSLTTLQLADNKVSDLSPLSGLTNLSVLDLTGNSVSDISPLSGLTRMTRLRLPRNPVDDILPVSRMTDLTELYLEHTWVSDVSPVSGLTKLLYLNLTGDRVSDISPLSALGPRWVNIDYNFLDASNPMTTDTILALQSRGTFVRYLPQKTVNHPPSALSRSERVPPDTASLIILSAQDPDGDTLVYTVASVPSHGSLGPVLGNDVIYTPAAGFTGSDLFTFKVTDGLADSEVATVAIAVAAPNNAPVAVPDSYTATGGAALHVAAPGVLANDSDANGDDLSAIKLTSPAHGTLALNQDGSFTYEPVSGFVGTDSFRYQASDGMNASNSATVTIAVTAPATVWVRTTIELTGPTAAPTYSGSAELVARLKTSSDVALSGKTIVFERWSGSVWQSIGTAPTDANGVAVKHATGLTTKRAYRARFAELAPYRASKSATLWVIPKAYVRTPIAPGTMYKARYRTVYGWLRPKHAAGTYPVRIYKWKRTASGLWKSYGYVNAKAYDYSWYTKYSRSIRLPYAGRWRVRAYAAADSGHAATWSSGYDYVTVR